MRTLLRSMFACLAALAAPLAHAAVVEVRLSNFRFDPNDVTIQAGDTVRFINNVGTHDVRADNGSFASPVAAAPWTFERTFPNPGEVFVHCSVHSGPGGNINFAMNARINVVEAPAPTFAINQGLAGAWFNPPTSGQGMLVDVDPASRLMFVAWFTYVAPATAAAPVAGSKVGGVDTRWLTAQGNYAAGSDTAAMQLFRTSGGRFNTPGGTTTVAAGTLTLRFTDCSNATAAYSITEGNLTGTIPLVRVIPGTDLLCRSLGGAAAPGEGDD